MKHLSWRSAIVALLTVSLLVPVIVLPDFFFPYVVPRNIFFRVVVEIGAAVLVLALYITSDDVEVLYRWPTMLWPVCVAVLLWISRMWALAYRGSIDDDPVVVTLKDPASYAVGALIAMLMFVAAWM